MRGTVEVAAARYLSVSGKGSRRVWLALVALAFVFFWLGALYLPEAHLSPESRSVAGGVFGCGVAFGALVALASVYSARVE